MGLSERKPFVFLPFIGGSSNNHERDIATGHNDRQQREKRREKEKRRKEDVDAGLATQATNDSFKDMDEEAM
jgi:hypothetical protein